MPVIEVDTNSRRQVNRFIQVPFDLYHDCPVWVPPIVSDARRQLDRQRNPYYKLNDASFFLAVKDGQDVGRICVMEPRHYNDFKGVKHCFFYLFDCVDDQEVAHALFDTAFEWGRSRGLEWFRGPLGFMAADGFGMLAKGFEHRPAIGIPYNYPYYTTLAETWGFEREEEVLSGFLDIEKLAFPERIMRLADKVKERYGFQTKVFDSKRALRKWAAPRLAELYNRSLTHIAGDPPLSQEEVDVVADSLLMIADPKLIKFITKGDDIVGFLFCFTDISEGIKKAGGRILPFGWFHLLRDFKRTEWLNLNGMGIMPEYQGRGGTAVMYAELYRALKEFPQFKYADVVQMSEYNQKILNEMKDFGLDMYKVHHIYRRQIE